jgi:hypothetical protein
LLESWVGKYFKFTKFVSGTKDVLIVIPFAKIFLHLFTARAGFSDMHLRNYFQNAYKTPSPPPSPMHITYHKREQETTSVRYFERTFGRIEGS